MTLLKSYFWKITYWLLGTFCPKALVNLHYRRSFGRGINWNAPRDLNEKIQWLKFHSDTAEWTRLADKYAVREYVREKGFDDMLIPLIAKWDTAKDIDWQALPDRFVLKTNHGSGDALICTDKSKLDTVHWTKVFHKLLRQKFGRQLGETHYDRIKPCLIAEQLMDNAKQAFPSTSLIDYKIWTLNGKPAYVLVCYDRTELSCKLAIYDLDWNFHPEFSRSKAHYVPATEVLPRPKTLDRMIEAATVLAKGFPMVRIDFYEVDGHVYFGEMTFTPAGGFNDFYSQEFLNILGDGMSIGD